MGKRVAYHLVLCHWFYVTNISNQIKLSKSLSNSSFYAKACSKFPGPFSALLRPVNAAPSEEMLQQWRAVGNTEPNLTGPRFELHTYRSRDKSVITGLMLIVIKEYRYTSVNNHQRSSEFLNFVFRIVVILYLPSKLL